MTALSDSKLSALETLTGSTGALQDLEQAYLLLLVTGPVTASTIHDLWFQVFDEASIPAGQFNDRWYAYMDFILAPATEDHYNDREREYWDGGGTPIGPVGTPYDTLILASNPEAYYKLDDAAGPTMLDSSGNANDGDFVNATLGQPLIVNDAGNSVSFSGVAGSFANLKPGVMDLANGTSPKTLEAWFNTVDTVGPIMVARGPTGVPILGIYMGNDGLQVGDGQVFVLARDNIGGGLSTLASPLTYNDGQDHHVVLTMDAVKTWILYIDGAVVDTNTHLLGAGITTNDPQFAEDAISTGGAPHGSFAGRIDNGATYNTALSEATVQAHFNLGFAGFEPPFLANLSHWWDFTDQSQVFADTAGLTPITDGAVIQRVNDKGTAGDDLQDAASGITWQDDVVNELAVARNTVVAVPSRFTSQALATLIGGVGGFTYGGVHTLFSVPGGQGILHAIDNGPSNVSLETGFGDWAEEHPNQGTTFSNKAVVANEWVSHIVSDGGPSGYIQHVSGAADVTAIAAFAIQAGTPVEIFAQSVEGEIGEILVYDRGLTAAELLVLQAYYDAKYEVLPFVALPPAIASIIHHYDFTDNDTVFRNLPGTQEANDGDAIRLIKDKGANPADLTTATGPTSPTYRVGFVNGQNVCDFVGGAVSKPMTGTDGPGHLGMLGMTNALIFRLPGALGAAVQMVDWGAGVGRLRGLRDFGAGFMLWDYPGPIGAFSLAVITPGDWYLWYASFTGAAVPGDDRAKLSGELQQILGGVVPSDILPGEIIAIEHITAQNIQIAEWVVWDGPLTDPELAALTAYADAKYGTLPHA